MQSVTGSGRVVAGRYELLDLVGHGAMGTVWRARDLRLDREVAVKEVRVPGPMTSQDRNVLRERSLREARVAARLSHPGVVTVHDVIEAEGTPWIIMELVPSRSLSRVLAEDGPLTPARAAMIGMTLLDALGTAHAAGVVHRDVKPGNILITHDGRAVLTDFGIATMHGDPGLTQAGMVMGTPGFCAPERIRGQPASPASDLWSLGATLYAAVEGRAPFEGQGSAMAVLANIVHGDPPPAKSAGGLGPVITALMRRDPAVRPDAAAARRMLAAACIGSGAGTRPSGEARASAGAGSAAQGESAPLAGAGAGALGNPGAVAAAGALGNPGAVAGATAPVGPDALGGGGAAAAAGTGYGSDAGYGSSVRSGVAGERAADGIPGEPGTVGPAGPGSTLTFPAALDGAAALAGQPPAATASPATVAAPDPSLTVPAPRLADPAGPGLAGKPGPGGQRRRPGRHRRALLFGGGGTAVVLAALLTATGLASQPGRFRARP